MLSNREFNLILSEKELRALEMIISCADETKMASSSKLALSMHKLKISDVFLALEKITDFIQENLKRDGE